MEEKGSDRSMERTEKLGNTGSAAYETAKDRIFVIGHKNPDTDSICSAISYAWLQNMLSKANREGNGGKKGADASEGPQYVPMRAGHINQETAFVLRHFGVSEPDYLADAAPQVQDIAIKKVRGVSASISLKEAYAAMREQESVTLPVLTEEGFLQGVITINDIAESDMDVYDNRIVGKARTPVANILKTLEGKLLCGNLHAQIVKGRAVIAAAKGEAMSDFLEQDDLVLTANRESAQRCAIRKGASLLLITGGEAPSEEILKEAERSEVIVILTPHDTWTAARLLNQSMPVRRFMCTKDLVSFHLGDTAEAAQKTMTAHRFRDFPVLDASGRYRGLISRRNLLGLRKKQLILVDHNELSQAVDGADQAEILGIIDHHRLGAPETALPVYFRCQPLGCTATIIAEICRENEVEIPLVIAGLLCSAILSDTLLFRSPTCTPQDEKTARALAAIAGIRDLKAYARDMFSAGSDLLGRSAEDIFFQDFKKFTAGDIHFGVGQITSMNEEDFPDLTARLRPFMEGELEKLQMDALYFLLTGILSESSLLIACGKNAVETAEAAFGQKADESGILHLSGVVSRKKQFIPPMILRLQEKG